MLFAKYDSRGERKVFGIKKEYRGFNMSAISKAKMGKFSRTSNISGVLLILLINRLLWHEIDRPERQKRYNGFDRYVSIEHLRHGRRADDA